MILGAGVFEKRAKARAFSKQLPVFLGCGRYDGNYPQALGALVHFRKLGAEVTLDTWPSIGHQFPEAPPEAMRQWLRMRAGGGGTGGRGRENGSRNGSSNCMPFPIRWKAVFALEEFVSLPFVKFFGVTAEKSAREKITDLLTNPAVATEKKWRGESRKILARESRDPLARDSEKPHRRLMRCWRKKRLEPVRGRMRSAISKRTQKTPQDGEGRDPARKARGAPPSPLSYAPSAPSTNPDRSPFLPPGIKVKPAK